MVHSVRRTSAALLAAGILLHISFFSSIHDRITCEGPECTSTILKATKVRGAIQDAPPHGENEMVHEKENDTTNEDIVIKKEKSQAQEESTATGLTRLRQDQEPAHLVYASDDASIPGVVQSIKSAMHYAKGPVVFHFVGDSPLPLPSLPNIKFYNISQVTKQFKLKDFTNPRKRAEKDRKTLNSSLANYVRFIMDSLVPDASKAMWVDADTIFKCDVTSMMQTTFQQSEHAVAAVAQKGRPPGLARRIKTHYSYIKWSFNAGVFVAHLDRWRERNLTDKIRNMTLTNQKKNFYKYGSQPPLTLVIGNDFEHLNAAWNVKIPLMNKYFKDHGNDAGICLLHWVGGAKPWKGNGQFRDWWKDYDKEVNHKTMAKIAERNRAEKARKWKQKVAERREKRLANAATENQAAQ